MQESDGELRATGEQLGRGWAPVVGPNGPSGGPQRPHGRPTHHKVRLRDGGGRIMNGSVNAQSTAAHRSSCSPTLYHPPVIQLIKKSMARNTVKDKLEKHNRSLLTKQYPKESLSLPLCVCVLRRERSLRTRSGLGRRARREPRHHWSSRIHPAHPTTPGTASPIFSRTPPVSHEVMHGGV